MPLPYPMNRYRPTRAPDGDGGFTETLGTPAVVFGIVEANKSSTTALFDMYEDVKIGDILGVTPEEASAEALYRVKTSARVLDTTAKELSIERMDRPVSP
jgi:hypothetical protein